MKNKKIKFLIIPLVIVLAVAGGVFWKIKQKQEVEAEIDELEKFIMEHGTQKELPELKVDTSDWQTYHSDEFGFSFKYPKDWEVAWWDSGIRPEFFKPFDWDNSGIKGKNNGAGGLSVKPINKSERCSRCDISFEKIIPRWRGKNIWSYWLSYEKAYFLDDNYMPSSSYIVVDGQFIIYGGGEYRFRIQDNNMIFLSGHTGENDDYINAFNGIINTLRFDDDFDPKKE